MERKIVLIGGGGHCKSVLDTLFRNKSYDQVVITDNNIPAGTMIMGAEVVGDDAVLPELLQNGFKNAFITVGSVKSTRVRHILYKKIIDAGFDIVNVIDTTAIVSEHSILGKGIFVGKNAVVNAGATIGDCSIINTGAIIEHECFVGEFTHISVNANLCGDVRVGADTLVGAGSTVIQGIEIGNNVIIGAGSTVIRNVEDNSIKYGIVK